MAVGGWYGPGGWSKWFYENWEYKKLMADDLGVATGEMGTLSRMVKRSKLAEQVLKPIAPVLDKLGYVGYVDNNCIIDADGPWPMEWTMRDGWPTKHNVTAHVKNEDPIQWMLDLVNGKDTMEAVDGEICVSVLIALPDFPYSKVTNKELCGIPIRGADNMEQIHLSEVMIGEAPTMVGDKVVTLPTYVTCGDYTMVVTGTGETITSARRKAYNAVKKVKIPNNPFYRPDIGAGRMKRQLPELHRMGYGKGMEF
jgi:phosphoribosylamine--glycine ligase